MPQVQLPGPASSGSQPPVTLVERDLMFSSSIHGHANTCICTYTYIYSLMKSKIWCVVCTYSCVCPCIYVQERLQVCALACEGHFVMFFLITLHFIFRDKVPSLNPELPERSIWLFHELWASSCRHLHRGVINVCHHTQLYTQVLKL